MKKIAAFIAVIGLALVVLAGVRMFAQSQSTPPSGKSAPVEYHNSAAVKNKAASPTPGPKAKQQSSQSTIGEGQAKIDTGHSNNNYWVEEIDVDGKGKVTDTQMLWDDKNKILFMATDKTFNCTQGGGTADGNLLVATYGKGNRANRPAGSGWWAVELDENECRVKSEGLYGCKFNQNGVNTMCGMVDLDEKNQDLVIIEAAAAK
jgi:hypothetical protein